MAKSTISEQAQNYAEVIVGQIVSNFDTLHFEIEECTALKDAQAKYDKASPKDNTLMDIDNAQKRLEIIQKSIGDVICDSNAIVEPLAVGLFGEWGSGKTHQLKLIEEELKKREKNKGDIPKPTIIPIFFNAWHFEKEEHIIVPLFQTLLDSVENYERTLGAIAKRGFKSTIYHLKNVLTSLHHGINFSSNYKYFMSDELDKKKDDKIIDTKTLKEKAQEKTNTEQLVEQTLSQLLKPNELDSIYLNIPQWIEKITLFEKVNFVFLIDDLDRCLPENTLKMLESIKLFLDVPSCAFVLAVDDDVVERGVLHHYRDYIKDAKEGLQAELPITGHEYLEKMIQLPMRLPVIDTVNVREFFKEHSTKWIRLIDIKHNPEELRTIQTPIDIYEELDIKESFYISPSIKLLDFFGDAIPPKPRKIKRTAKLFEAKIQLLHAMELKDKCSYELLAKITLLELFAPKILRFIQTNDYAEAYKALYDFHYVNDVEKKEKKNTLYDTKDILTYIEQNNDYTQEKKDRYKKLINLVGEHHHSRMVFDLSTVFSHREEYEPLKVAIEYRETFQVDNITIDRTDTSLLDKEMLEQLFLENNPETWGATLRTYNKTLTSLQVQNIIEEAQTRIDNKFNGLSFIANPEWVGQISKFVDNESYMMLLKASHNARFKTNDLLDFEIDSFAMTFAEYDKYCEIEALENTKDVGWGRGRRPVINVSWDDAKAYIKWLNENVDKHYKLPTESEWKLACMLGKKITWHFGDDEEKLKSYAWYDENAEGKSQAVGEKQPNDLGLYDMHGNVWEWCENWFDKKEKYKVLCGGSWLIDADSTRSVYRDFINPSKCFDRIGFRLLRTLV